ncbi:hypothetical protein [Streptomyces sp. NPDC002845]
MAVDDVRPQRARPLRRRVVGALHNPISSALAVEGVRSLISALPRLVADGQDMAARREILFGTYLGAVAFTGGGSGLHDKVCHVLGGPANSTAVPRAITVTDQSSAP